MQRAEPNDREELERELRSALRRVRELAALLPICGSCKSIRDTDGSWRRVEDYFSERLEVRFSHGICPCCSERLLAELDADQGEAA